MATDIMITFKDLSDKGDATTAKSMTVSVPDRCIEKSGDDITLIFTLGADGFIDAPETKVLIAKPQELKYDLYFKASSLADVEAKVANLAGWELQASGTHDAIDKAFKSFIRTDGVTYDQLRVVPEGGMP